MPISIRTSESFQASPETVFAAMTDLESAASWMPNLVRIERTGTGPLAAGEGWVETRRMFGREATEYFDVEEVIPPSRLRLSVDGTRGSTGQGQYCYTFELTPQGEGTHVTLSAEMDGFGRVMRLLSPLMKATFRRALSRDLQALKQYVDAGPTDGAAARS